MLDWFPDWNGVPCAIIGGGESVKKEDVEALRGRARVLVINRSHELAPWADALYAADGKFWDVYRGVPEFRGLKITPDVNAARHFKLKLVELLPQGVPAQHSIWPDHGLLARGGHSGHQALNLAIQFGARQIMLMGFDFVGEHWHGRYDPPLRNARHTSMSRWRDRMDALSTTLELLGINVVNCSNASALTAYPRMSIEEALALWTTEMKMTA